MLFSENLRAITFLKVKAEINRHLINNCLKRAETKKNSNDHNFDIAIKADNAVCLLENCEVSAIR